MKTSALNTLALIFSDKSLPAERYTDGVISSKSSSLIACTELTRCAGAPGLFITCWLQQRNPLRTNDYTIDIGSWRVCFLINSPADKRG